MAILLLLLGKLFLIFLFKLILGGGITIAISILTSIFKFLASLWFSGIPIGNEQTLKIPFSIKKNLVKSALGNLSSEWSNNPQNTNDNHVNSSKLTLSHNDEMVAGVFGGIAEYLGLSAVVLRIVFVGAVLYFGVYLVIFYVLAIFFMKKYET